MSPSDKIKKMIGELEEHRRELICSGASTSKIKYIDEYLQIYQEQLNLMGKTKCNGNISESLG